MAIVHGAENYATPVMVEGFPRKVLENGEWQYEEEFYIASANVENYVPAKNSVNSEGYIFTSAEITSHAMPGMVISKVHLMWRENSYSGGGGGTGPLTELSYDCNNTVTEHKIEDHPEFKKATEEQKEFLKANMPTFIVHSVTFSRTQRKLKSSWHPTFAEIVGTVGALEAPTDLQDATASTWLHTGKRISWTKSDRIEYTDEWTYDAYGWQGSIFPTTTLAEMLAIAKGTDITTDGDPYGGSNA